jgi:dUTPase
MDSLQAWNTFARQHNNRISFLDKNSIELKDLKLDAISNNPSKYPKIYVVNTPNNMNETPLLRQLIARENTTTLCISHARKHACLMAAELDLPNYAHYNSKRHITLGKELGLATQEEELCSKQKLSIDIEALGNLEDRSEGYDLLVLHDFNEIYSYLYHDQSQHTIELREFLEVLTKKAKHIVMISNSGTPTAFKWLLPWLDPERNQNNLHIIVNRWTGGTNHADNRDNSSKKRKRINHDEQQIRIKRLNAGVSPPNLPNEANGNIFLRTVQRLVLQPYEYSSVVVGLQIQTTQSMCALVLPSSTNDRPLKNGLQVFTSIINSRKPEDVVVYLKNISHKTIVLTSGNVVAQLVPIPIPANPWLYVNEFSENVHTDCQDVATHPDCARENNY